MFTNYVFEDPAFFWLLALVPLAVGWYLWRRNQQQATLKLSNTQGFLKGTDVVAKLHPLIFILKALAFIVLVIAIARPRTVDETTQVKSTKGIDIALAIDISPSMYAKDLKPNRLEALKKVAADFIKGRITDRVGLVVYSGESYTKTPLTSDRSIVLSALSSLKYTNTIDNGTAIGSGLATAVNRLKNSKAKSRVIILLTDGSNNSGFIDPKIASELALKHKIKVYTIGMGTNGNALSPVALDGRGGFRYAMVPVEIDEELLKQIAKTTGGLYFRATDNRSLKAIYDEIDKLEKTDIEELKFTQYHEKYRIFAILAFVFFALAYVLKQTIFKSFI